MEHQVSLFVKGATQTENPENIDFLEVARRIVSGYWAKPIQRLRASAPADSDAIKKKLPYFTVSGIFDKRADSGLLRHSGLISVDIDHLDDSAEDVRDILAKDPATFFVSLSCSGKGVFVVIRMDPSRHKETLSYIEAHYAETYNIRRPTFNYLADVSRARFISHDPGAVINEDAEVIVVPEPFLRYLAEKNAAPKPPSPKPPKVGADHPYTAKAIKNTIERIKSRIANAADGEKHNELVRASFHAGGLVGAGYISESEAFELLEAEILAKPNVKDPDAARQTIKKSLKKGAESPLYFAPPPITAPQGYQAPAEKVDVKQSTAIKWETPRFDPLIFEYLPSPIPELLANLEGRKKDIALVSIITSLSGLFPEVKGLYGGKDTYPNLFGFICAPPGTGKSIIDHAQDAGHASNEKIAARNAAAMENWQAEVEAAKAQKGKDIPIQPKTERLYIPANTTNKALINALSENESLIGIETEADTIVLMFKQDHGDFSDVLRKAFEHERIATMRVVAESTEADCPKLSFLIAGTPDQLPKLIKNADNGLFSRFMFYGFEDVPVFQNPFESPVNFRQLWRSHSYYIDEIREAGGFEFGLSKEQQRAFTNKFTAMTTRYYKLSGSTASSVVFRMGKILFRIAMILTRLAYGSANLRGQYAECPENIYIVADMIAECLIKHSFIVLDGLHAGAMTDERQVKPETAEKQEERKSANVFLDNLPKTFTTAEAVSAGAALGISAPTIKRHLAKYLESGLLEQPHHGKYTKKQ